MTGEKAPEAIGKSMPELPEVETVRRIIAPEVVGKRITHVALRDFPGVLEAPDGMEPQSAIVGSTIVDVHRRGKYLLFSLDSGLWLIIHLRMTGRLLIVPSGSTAVRFEHLAIELEGGHDLRFGDQRKFGRARVTLPEEVAALDARLGPEPFDTRLTGRRLHEAMRRRSGKIKAVLLDQHFLAGLGNIYVDEALHRTRIHPEHTARDLTLSDATRLLGAIRHVLRCALDNQGTTFSTFENPYGESGANAAFLRVYGRGRTDDPCPRCGTPLQHLVVGGRGTTICPRCQRLPSEAAGALSEL
jgi:formamidopyrimidine-DNA glycosylase